MDELSITFGIGGDLGGKSVRSAPIHVAAEITRAKSSNKKLTGRMLYLVPRQLREIKDSKDVIAFRAIFWKRLKNGKFAYSG
jgi:hypothetical protein